MVKKHKGGRRQILQLEDKKPRNEWEPTSTASLNKEASPLDSQVADFFKEIDALTVNEHIEESNSEAACVSSEIASCSKQRDTEDSKPEDNLPEKSEGNHAEVSKNEVGSYCAWQEICDESTGYNYYWNVETNDVTWDCPSEYILYLKTLQSAENEYFSVSNDSNSNETYKKTKRKKDLPLPPEGAIIPISYFGNSSSEDSSEDEKENGLATALMNAKQKGKAKVNIVNRQNCSKKDSHSSDNKKDFSIEAMGPHLPNENHLSKTHSADRTSILSKEAEINSKNEVDEYLEIGPQLASNSGVDLSKSGDCNTVSDSSSKCSSVSHLVKNGPSVASSTYEEPWEVSLMNIERKFRGLDQDIGEESPDSTVRKGDASSENSVPCQTSNDTFGIRGVVEYDNFTDEEEEMGSSNISSSKQESVTSQRPMSSAYRKSRDCDNSVQRQFDSGKSEVSQSEAQKNFT